MVNFTTTPWGVHIPAHGKQDLRPTTRADAVRMASALRMLADHLEKVSMRLGPEGADDAHATPHVLSRIGAPTQVDGLAQPTGVRMFGRGGL